jgi:hypothetical protein
MMEIFIPVLFICMNGNCDFMQAQTVYRSEAQCRVSIDNQKTHMLEIADRAGQGKYTVLEGTCINTKINSPGKQI